MEVTPLGSSRGARHADSCGIVVEALLDMTVTLLLHCMAPGKTRACPTDRTESYWYRDRAMYR